MCAVRRSRAATWWPRGGEALEADIVIINHHLLLADLALKEDGFGDLLGCADAVILDETHQIPDLATQFFGANIGSRQIETLLKDLPAGAVLRGVCGAVARHFAAGRRRRSSRGGYEENSWSSFCAATSGRGRPQRLDGDSGSR